MKKLLIIPALLLALNTSYAQAQEPTKKKKEQTKMELKDPVCHMKVSKDAKIVATHKDHQYGFCSESCKTRFVANPEKYVKKD